MPIVAIGGGEIRTKETLPIDREIVRLAQRSCGERPPNALFVGTATRDLGGYITTFKKYYQQELGCRVQPLILTRGEEKKPAEIEARVAWADIVYVGGGNTRFMLEVWTRLGVPGILERARARGCVLSGLSAGALCWFERGVSDADRLEGLGDAYIELPALGFLPGVYTPHFNHPGVEETFTRVMIRDLTEKGDALGYGVDDGAALFFDEARNVPYAIRVRPEARAERWTVRDETLEKGNM